jgi:hypothetical protein
MHRRLAGTRVRPHDARGRMNARMTNGVSTDKGDPSGTDRTARENTLQFTYFRTVV